MSAEMRVIVDNTVAVSGPGGGAITTTTTAGAPRAIPAAAFLNGSGTVADSTTNVTLVTVPAGKTFIGTINVTANSRATTAAYATLAAVVGGAGVGVPVSGTVVALAGSSRDAGACPVTVPIQVTCTSGVITIDIKASTATTFNGSGYVIGELV